MLVFESFIAGFTSVLGAVVGVLVVFMLIPKRDKLKKKKYEPGDLIKPFQRYFDQLAEHDSYEQMQLVIMILENLQKGIIIDSVYAFHIKKIPKISFSSRGSDNQIRFENEYKVVQLLDVDLKTIEKNGK